jgi:hypothetical protein
MIIHRFGRSIHILYFSADITASRIAIYRRKYSLSNKVWRLLCVCEIGVWKRHHSELQLHPKPKLSYGNHSSDRGYLIHNQQAMSM